MPNQIANKEVMAQNIQRYMDKKSMTKLQLSEAIDVPYSTIRSWLKAKAYPRIDKIEKMSIVFGCSKSDLVEPFDPNGKHEITIPYKEEWINLIDILEESSAEDVERATAILLALKRVNGR